MWKFGRCQPSGYIGGSKTKRRSRRVGGRRSRRVGGRRSRRRGGRRRSRRR